MTCSGSPMGYISDRAWLGPQVSRLSSMLSYNTMLPVYTDVKDRIGLGVSKDENDERGVGPKVIWLFQGYIQPCASGEGTVSLRSTVSCSV